MKKLKEFFTDLTETVTVTKLDGVLIVTIGALAGVIIGMLCSPRKNVKFGCNNGNTTSHNWGDEDDEDLWDGEFDEDYEDFEDDEDDCLSFK